MCLAERSSTDRQVQTEEESELYPRLRRAVEENGVRLDARQLEALRAGLPAFGAGGSAPPSAELAVAVLGADLPL